MWWKQVMLACTEYGVKLETGVKNLEGWKRYVSRLIQLKVTGQWVDRVEEFSSLECIRGEVSPKWAGFMDGSWGSKALFRLRNGDWQSRGSNVEGNRSCMLCGVGENTIWHVIGECQNTWERVGRQRGVVWDRKGVRDWLRPEGDMDDLEWDKRKWAAGSIVSEIQKNSGGGRTGRKGREGGKGQGGPTSAPH